MTYKPLILPKEFFEAPLYIELPYKYLDHIDEIAEDNGIPLWKPQMLKPWIEDRKHTDAPVCIYLTSSNELCCCSKWWAEHEPGTRGIIIVENFEKLCDAQLQHRDILDLL